MGSRIALTVLVVLSACGDKKHDGPDPAGKVAADPGHPAAVVDESPLPLGVAAPADFNYLYGKGDKAFEPAAAAAKARDWAAVKAACETTLALDPNHLDAHRLLATALAQTGDPSGAFAHLRVALAGDLGRWVDGLATDADLAPLRTSPLGAKLDALVTAYRATFAREARAGLLVVARRSAFRPPSKPGKQRAYSRGELFTYDRETQRYVRLSHTDWAVAGFVRAPSGDELAYLSYSQVELGDPKAAVATPPVLAEMKVGTLRLGEPSDKAIEAPLKHARTVELGYLTGDQLVAVGYDAEGLLGLGKATAYAIDKAAGKAKPTKLPTLGPSVWLRYDAVDADGVGPTGVTADWRDETGAASEFVLDSSKQRVALKGEEAVGASFAWSPDQRHAVFATAANPCAPAEEDRQASLYLVEVESGKLKHVFKGQAGLHARFVDDNVLAYDDDDGAVRLYDVTGARELAKLAVKGGVGLVGVATGRGAMCRDEHATAEPVAPTAPAGGTAADDEPPPAE